MRDSPWFMRISPVENLNTWGRMRSFIEPPKPQTIQEASESEYGSEYGSEYESDSDDEAAASAAAAGKQPLGTVADDEASEYESDEDDEDEEEEGIVGFALYDWVADAAGQCSVTVGAKYRVTHDGAALSNAGWIGVVPVKAAVGGGDGDGGAGGLVPKNYLQLPET